MSSPLIVVGGAYGEECSFPLRQVFRGSGGRSAAILSSLGAPVILSTVTGPGLRGTFQSIATKLGYELNAREGQQDIWFRYRHPLAQPTIFPVEIEKLTQAAVEADLALVFGMVEGRLPIHARRVVYDPQDGFAARPFGENGSTADELAIVLSHSEGLGANGQKRACSYGERPHLTARRFRRCREVRPPRSLGTNIGIPRMGATFPDLESLQNWIRRCVLRSIFLRLAR